MAHLPQLDGQTCIDCGTPTFCGFAHGGDHDHSRQARECTSQARQQGDGITPLPPVPRVEICVRCDQPSDELDGWTQRCPACDEAARFDAGR